MSVTEHYTVLARRFRPQRFDEVVGQQPVAQSLKNAMKNGRVAHAYLFTGARGVGKTSMARILAKALNCPNADDGEPCNECEICTSISSGQDVDVLEIDGASNRRIDDIRSLRSNVGVKSMRTSYKLYIIDEVHMLTKEAFNALLKTLEEPPPGVKFVFCTTEPNRVPDTILSRCQRFDFSTIDVAKITTRLGQIGEAEGREVDADALELIARRANGSMRDSQSLFDQLLAFGDDHITVTDVHRLFGTADDERLLSLAAALADDDRETIYRELDEAIERGVQLPELNRQLLSYFRDLLAIGSGAESVALLGVTERHRGTVIEHAARWSPESSLAALEILAETETRLGRSTLGRVLVEMALIRIALLDRSDEISTLIAAIRHGQTPGGAVTAAAPKRLPAKSSASPTVSSTTARTDRSDDPIDDQTPDLKKKVDEIEVAVESTEEADSSVTLLKINPADLLSQIVGKSSVKLKAQISRSTLAILEPNEVVFRFAPGYHFGVDYCERPPMRSEVVTLLEEIIGQPVRLRFEVAEDSPPMTNLTTEANPSGEVVPKPTLSGDGSSGESPPNGGSPTQQSESHGATQTIPTSLSSPTRTESPPRSAKPQSAGGQVTNISDSDVGDPFVQEAISVFDATPVKREDVLRAVETDEDTPEPEDSSPDSEDPDPEIEAALAGGELDAEPDDDFDD